MTTLSISRWTDWSDIVAAAEQAGGDANKHCSWIGKDPENQDNAILIYDEAALDSQSFEQAFANQDALEAKRAADLKNIQGFRKNEYPSIGDQLDALWKGGEAATEMLAKVQAIKNKYPKPE